MTTIPTYDFVWQQGEDGEVSIVYRQDGTPVNLTGYTVRMDVRNSAGLRLFTFNSADIVDAADPGADSVGNADNEGTVNSQGEIHIVVPRAVTLGNGPLVDSIGLALLYDIFLRDTNNKQRKILHGTITIEASQTKWT